MYLEAVRYFGGLSKNASFDANDNSYISGLTDVNSWTDPLNATNRCANCSIIMINASDISYDGDSLSMAGLPGSPSATDLTDDVGDLEGITGNSYFIGTSGGSTDQLCTAKTINNLGSVTGTCPGAPRLDGTYNIAGIAHWARTEDVRDDLDDDQNITTYAVALSPAAPAIVIPNPVAGGNPVSIIPACRNSSINGNCAIVDFKVLEQNIAAGTGKLYVNWEDSEQGGDYDQDMAGIITYAFNGAGTQIAITTEVKGQSTGYAMGFGYVVAGTTNDGYHVHSGIHGFNDTTDTASPNDCTVVGGCDAGDPASTITYTVGSSSASLLQDPLWYAAKYGGFNDYDGDKNPNESDDSEWDVRDVSGSSTPDGIPDNYFPVTDPAYLQSRLETVLNAILNRVAAGSAAAVVSNTTEGVGAVYQALYQPTLTKGNTSVEWAGFLHAVFIDDCGILREDSDGDGSLDGVGVDKPIRIYYDETLGEARVQRYSAITSGCAVSGAVGASVSIHDLDAIWVAQDQLGALNDSQLASNRTYTNGADNGRYIFTWIDRDGDNVVDAGETVDFDTTGMNANANDFRYMDVADAATMDDIINFIRGIEGVDPGFRSRTIDYDDDGTDDVMRLGDIVHSSPTVVGAPKEAYHLLYDDTSYEAFKDAYKDRRNVVYVGANDGMLHAFNAGFFDLASNTFTAGGHPLGSELWAYIPMNLLPHLKWLAEQDYPHVYYVDGPPQAYDVRIFASDGTHPGGWGTILVVPMRLGGGEMTIDTDGDAAYDRTLRSAVVVLDVTDPEQPPTVLAELTDDTMGFTTSMPALIKSRFPSGAGDWNTPTTNEWELVIGSGPTDLDTVSSNQNALLYRYDLVNNTWVTGFSDTSPHDTGISNAFVGDMAPRNWDRASQTLVSVGPPAVYATGYDDEVVYFGLTSGNYSTNPTSEGGGMMRLKVATNVTNLLIDTGQPVTAAPSMTGDTNGDRWVMFGTGRIYTDNDAVQLHQESFYGVKEPQSGGTFLYTGTVLKGDLFDVTDIRVYTDGSIDDNGTGVLPMGVDTWQELADEIEASYDGWYRDFTYDGTNPSQRNTTASVLLRSTVLFTAFTPTPDACDAIGVSHLFAISSATGTANPYDTIGIDTTVTPGKELSLDNIELGLGLASSVTIHTGSKSGTKAVSQSSTGEIFDNPVNGDGGGGGGGGGGGFGSAFGRQSWQEIWNYD
jgi:type IV pilus assembly protein PilY1